MTNQGQATMHPIPNHFPQINSSSPEWFPSHKNPRVFRASRSSGGKARHSKVCTLRGLRDRRISLPLHIAVQLYDLQHLLGLNQPSKVVDWLLDTAKLEIDKLPPLPALISPEQTHQEREEDIEEGILEFVANNQWPYIPSSYCHRVPQNLSPSQLPGGVGVGLGLGFPFSDERSLSSSQLYHLCHLPVFNNNAAFCFTHGGELSMEADLRFSPLRKTSDLRVNSELGNLEIWTSFNSV